MPTIWDSFKQALPQARQLGEQKVVNSKQTSGTTSATCTPPRCCITIPVAHWTDLAARWCLEKQFQKLQAKHLPEKDGVVTPMLKSEADVADASTLYLAYPVHVAYKLLHPKDTRLNQLTRPAQDGDASSRADMAYFSGEPSNKDTPGNSNNIFAVMEYKKFGGLPMDQFTSGIVRNYIDFERASDRPLFRPALSKNAATSVLQQATHYVWKYGTPFVALFDYKTLILLFMAKVEDSDAGQYTYMTVVSEPKMMRKAYLGFLLAARLYSSNKDDSSWRKTRDGKDLFTTAEDWQRQLESSKSKKNEKRAAGAPAPNYVAPSSQESN